MHDTHGDVLMRRQWELCMFGDHYYSSHWDIIACGMIEIRLKLESLISEGATASPSCTQQLQVGVLRRMQLCGFSHRELIGSSDHGDQSIIRFIKAAAYPHHCIHRCFTVGGVIEPATIIHCTRDLWYWHWHQSRHFGCLSS